MKGRLKGAVLSAFALLFASSALALGIHALRDGPPLLKDFTPPIPEGVEQITVDDAVQMWRKALFIDARESVAYQQEHIATALSQPVEQELDAKVLKMLGVHDTVIIYCNGPECGASAKVARKLLEGGAKNKLLIMTDGLPGWRNKGYPMVFPGQDTPAPPPRPQP